jgi:NAD(P)-dependent dehydrogenase (short-subunit alcohol dehydrogenase family)
VNWLTDVAVELRQAGIKVVTIAPGFIATPMTQNVADPMPFLMPVEEFAIAAAAAIDTGASFKIIPWQMRWLMKVVRTMPNRRHDAVLSRKWHMACGRRAVL